MPISFRRITRDGESSRPRSPFVNKLSGGSVLGASATRQSASNSGGKPTFQKAKGTFLPNYPSKPAALVGKVGSPSIKSNAMRSQGGSWSGSKHGDFLAQQLNQHADAALKDLPSLKIGMSKSLDLSLEYENDLYIGYLRAGGTPYSFFAQRGNVPKYDDRIRSKEDRVEIAMERILGFDVDTTGMSYDELRNLYSEAAKLQRLTISNIKYAMKDIVGDLNLNVKIDYGRLTNLSVADLLTLLSVHTTGLAAREDGKHIEGATFDTLFAFSVLESTGIISADENGRGLKDFRLLSDIAAHTTDNKADYLYVMNSLLLHYSSPGDLNTALSAQRIRNLSENNASIIDTMLSEPQIQLLYKTGVLDIMNVKVVKIGSGDLDYTYDEMAGGRDEQISRHIWAFLTTSAVQGGTVGAASAFFHDVIQRFIPPDGDGVIQMRDFHAGRVAAEIGDLLYRGLITPDMVGKLVEATFSKSFAEFDTIIKDPDWYKKIVLSTES